MNRSIPWSASAAVAYGRTIASTATFLMKGRLAGMLPASRDRSTARDGGRYLWLGRLWQSTQSMRRISAVFPARP